METVIKSNLFSNVIIKERYESYHLGVENDTNVFTTDTAYSIIDLVGKGLLANILQWETVCLTKLQSELQFLKALVNDMQYSKTCFSSSYDKFKDISTISDKVGYCKFSLQFEKEGYVLFKAYGTDVNMCSDIVKHYIKHYHASDKLLNLETSQFFKVGNTFKGSDYVAKDVLFIPDHGKQNLPMVETAFYKWLEKNKINNPHRIHTRKQYLTTLGFDNKNQRVFPEDLEMLKIILDHYYYDKRVK